MQNNNGPRERAIIISALRLHVPFRFKHCGLPPIDTKTEGIFITHNHEKHKHTKKDGFSLRTLRRNPIKARPVLIVAAPSGLIRLAFTSLVGKPGLTLSL
jgi:hypothetical protein